MVDIDNSRIDDDNDTLQDPIEFLDSHYSQESIFRFILTHPDMDHMSGLHELFTKRYVYNFWDTEHEKAVDTSQLNFGGYSKHDWLTYKKLRAGSDNPKVLRLLHNSQPKSYWVEDGITVFSPSPNMLKLASETDEYNHSSYVLMIEHEGMRILLGGDATKRAWRQILANHGKDALKAHVFLAPHHGSPDNIEEDVFQHIAPQYVIVSDHRGHSYDYSYYSRLASKQVYSTKHFGNIELIVSKNQKTITPEKNR